MRIRVWKRMSDKSRLALHPTPQPLRQPHRLRRARWRGVSLREVKLLQLVGSEERRDEDYTADYVPLVHFGLHHYQRGHPQRALDEEQHQHCFTPRETQRYEAVGEVVFTPPADRYT